MKSNGEIVIKFDPETKADFYILISALSELIKRIEEVERKMAEVILKEAEK